MAEAVIAISRLKTPGQLLPRHGALQVQTAQPPPLQKRFCRMDQKKFADSKKIIIFLIRLTPMWYAIDAAEEHCPEKK